MKFFFVASTSPGLLARITVFQLSSTLTDEEQKERDGSYVTKKNLFQVKKILEDSHAANLFLTYLHHVKYNNNLKGINFAIEKVESNKY